MVAVAPSELEIISAGMVQRFRRKGDLVTDLVAAARYFSNRGAERLAEPRAAMGWWALAPPR